MAQQTTTQEKKSLLRNDSLLVCGMLIVYGVCILGLIGATIWGLDKRSKRISIEATSAASRFATLEAYATATAVARVTDQPHYTYRDEFYSDVGRWPVGSRENEYWVGSVEIKDDAYIWDIREVKTPFIWLEDIPIGPKSKDFDVTVESKIVEGNEGEVCSGLMFRKSPEGWDSGVYAFSVCNDSHFEVHYYGKGGWDDLFVRKYNDTISNAGRNQIGVSARGNRFLLMINYEVVFELRDDRQKMGGLAMFIELKEEHPTVVLFDSFAYGSR